MVHVSEITSIPNVYNSHCLANHALLVKSVFQTISKNKQKLMHKFLTVPLNNKLTNYQAIAAQKNLSYDITAVEEISTDMLILICKQLNISDVRLTMHRNSVWIRKTN